MAPLFFTGFFLKFAFCVFIVIKLAEMASLPEPIIVQHNTTELDKISVSSTTPMDIVDTTEKAFESIEPPSNNRHSKYDKLELSSNTLDCNCDSITRNIPPPSDPVLNTDEPIEPFSMVTGIILFSLIGLWLLHRMYEIRLRIIDAIRVLWRGAGVQPVQNQPQNLQQNTQQLRPQSQVQPPVPQQVSDVQRAPPVPPPQSD